MKKTTFFLLLFNFISPGCFPQLLDWAFKTGGTYIDECYDLANDNAGNIYLTGGFCNSVNFNPNGTAFFLQSSGTDVSDIYFAKYDHDFNLVWAFGLGNSNWETGLAIKTDPEKNVYISGNYTGTVDFDPGPGTSVLSTSTMRYFLAKYDSNGQFKWVRDIGSDGNNYLTVPPRVRIFPGKSLEVYTWLLGNDTLRKFNSNGYPAWKKPLPGMPVSGIATSLFSVNNCKNPFEYSPYYQDSLRFNKIGGNGDFDFSKTIARTADGFIGGYINYDINGKILLSGRFWGTVHFYRMNDTVTISNYDSTMVYPNTYDHLAREFITKIDTSGNADWVKHFINNGPSPYIIRTNANGEIFTAGFLNFSANFDPAGSVILTNGGFGNYIAKYDSSFNYVACATFLGGSYNDFIGGFGLHGDTAVICGHFFNTIDLDLTNATHFLSAASPEDIFVSQYSHFNITTNAASINELPNAFLKMPVYPNPSDGNFCLRFVKNTVKRDIKITNLTGQEVYSQTACQDNTDIKLSGCHPGIYFLTIIQGNERMTSKLIIMN
ncbi:MAG: T9SS type A sorting domain-containing protein [Bacteroidota bacterium]